MVSAWEISTVVPLMEAGLLGSAYTDSASLCLGGRKGRGVTPQASAYPPQNARMAFCSAAALQNPNAAAALLSPPYCLVIDTIAVYSKIVSYKPLCGFETRSLASIKH